MPDMAAAVAAAAAAETAETSPLPSAAARRGWTNQNQPPLSTDSILSPLSRRGSGGWAAERALHPAAAAATAPLRLTQSLSQPPSPTGGRGRAGLRIPGVGRRAADTAAAVGCLGGQGRLRPAPCRLEPLTGRAVSD